MDFKWVEQYYCVLIIGLYREVLRENYLFCSIRIRVQVIHHSGSPGIFPYFNGNINLNALVATSWNLFRQEVLTVCYPADWLCTWEESNEHELFSWVWEQVSKASSPQRCIHPQERTKSWVYTGLQIPRCKVSKSARSWGSYGCWAWQVWQVYWSPHELQSGWANNSS